MLADTSILVIMLQEQSTEIRYSLVDSVPAVDGTVYTEPFYVLVDRDITIRAVGVRDNSVSEEATVTYRRI